MPAPASYTFPENNTREACLDGFWGWVGLLASGDYDFAARSLGNGDATVYTGDSLKERIETFFGADQRLTVVVPNERLVGVINESAEINIPENGRPAWMLAMIPLTNEPGRAKEDDVMLMGAAVSFFIEGRDGGYGLDFEIFHA